MMKTPNDWRAIRDAAIKTVAGLFLAATLNTGMAAGKLSYSYFSVGDPAQAPVIAASDRAATPSYVLMGGGDDQKSSMEPASMASWVTGLGRSGTSSTNGTASPSSSPMDSDARR